MNERNFIVAVIIALIVPVIVGTFYFVDMNVQMKSSNYVYDMKEGRELLLLGNDRLVENDNIFDFQVNYVTGEKEYETYKIVLDNIEISSFDDDKPIKWILSMLDSASGEYFDFATGTIDDEDIDRLVISPEISIALDKSQLFKLYYYVLDSESDSNSSELNASIALE